MNKLYFVITIVLGCAQPSINLEDFHRCAGAVIGDTDHALAIYAENIEGCGRESIIAFEKFEFRDALGRAHYKIVDTVRVALLHGGVLALTQCDDGETQNVVLVKDESKQYFNQVIRSWTYDETFSELIEIETKGLRCLNAGFLD